MAGVETGVIIAGKFLAPFAAPAVKALSKKACYRRQVERRMRKFCNFSYSKRRVRKWLQRLTIKTLSEPRENSVPQLACDLDQWLGTEDSYWTKDPYRTAHAIELANAAYLAIYHTYDEKQARQLQEEWSQSRHQEIISNFVKIAKGRSGLRGLTTTDVATWLRGRSDERRNSRIKAFDIDDNAVQLSLDSLENRKPTVPLGSIRILVGSFGAGKSEIAETWHKAQIEVFASTQTGATPIWIFARQIGNEGLDRVIEHHYGPEVLHGIGVSVVIDGLDEVDGARAEEIVHDARMLVASNPSSSVLLTARPGVLTWDEATSIAVEGLDRESALELISAISGQKGFEHSWSTELIETVSRPFFALAAGSLLNDGKAPTGQAELIKQLVERSLSKGSTATATAPENVQDALLKMATSLTKTNGAEDGLRFHERQLANSTRLVAATPGDQAKFALPIFEQWFAAQALLDNPTLVAEALETPNSFDRWRWVLAVAVISAPRSTADTLIEACIRMNPGAGSWLIDQISRGWQSKTTIKSDGIRVDTEILRQQVFRAARVWIDAIGPLAPAVVPGGIPSGHFRMGFAVKEESVVIGWSNAAVLSDELVDLPDDLSPVFDGSPSEWISIGWLVIPSNLMWPWVKMRDIVAKGILPLLQSNDMGKLQGTVWQAEVRYRTARIITGTQSALHTPMESKAIVEAANELLGISSIGSRQTFVLRGKTVEDWQLRDLLEWIEAESIDLVTRPVPGPDRSLEDSDGWMDALYSDQKVQRFSVEMLGMACAAYEEATRSIFPSFGWSISRNAYEPMGSIGFLTINGDSSGWGRCSLSHIEVPLSILNRYISENREVLIASNGRAVVTWDPTPKVKSTENIFAGIDEEISLWASKSTTLGPFWGVSWSGGIIRLNEERPASEMAARWIYSDLKKLSLAPGTFPQLAR